MKRKMLWLLVINILGMASCMFFHDRSPIVINPKDVESNYFGYSLSYQENTKTLVVGAPNDPIGKVLTCPLDLSPTMPEFTESCFQYNTSYVENLPDMKRYENQFRLGASVAALPNSFLTCAPNWSGKFRIFEKMEGLKEVLSENSTFFVWGGCFEVKNEKFETLQGLYSLPRNRGATMGNFGLKMLVDEVNELVLISKPGSPSLIEDIAYIHIKYPLNSTESLVISKLTESNERKNTISERLKKFRNLGTAMTSGKFFDIPTDNNIIYAVDFTDSRSLGGIIFLKYRRHYLNVIDKNQETFEIIQDEQYSMFGAALCSATLNDDKYSDLIVGAPADYDKDKREYGAIHIYTGASSRVDFMQRKLLIRGKTERSRFGTTISAHDLDDDGLQEIFVSAPYENGGVLYILSGFEINMKLEVAKTTPVINVMNFESRQEIHKKGFNLLGFSITPVSDLDNNGCDELAVGAPGNDKVMILRCIRTVNITVNATLLGEQTIPEEKKDFNINVCIYLTFNPKVTDFSANNYVTMNTNIDNPRTVIDEKDRKFSFHINKKNEKYYCKNVNVKINEFGRFIFEAKANLDTEIYDTSDTFDKSWVRLSPYSQVRKTLTIERACSDADCIYDMEMIFSWSGRNADNYPVGSQDEVLTLQVINRGRKTDNACVLINVIGALVSKLGCADKKDGYTCLLPREFIKKSEWHLQIGLKTSSLTNEYEGLRVTAVLFNDCGDRTLNKTRTFNMNYDFDKYIDTQISVDGATFTRSITEKSMKTKSDTIDVIHKYTIKNKGNVDWKNVTMVISNEASYLKELKVNIGKCTADKMNSIKCFLDLKPESTVKIVVTSVLRKKEIENSLIENSLKISTKLSLHLTPTSKIKQKRLEGTLLYEKDSSIAQNKTLIIIIAVIIAIIIFIVFFFILYKVGFFKRKQKEELKEMKRRSMLSNAVSQRQDSVMELKDEDLKDDDINCVTLPAPSAREQTKRTSTQLSIKDMYKMDENEKAVVMVQPVEKEQ